MSSARPHPSFVHRRSPPDALAVRQHWRALAADALAMAQGAGDGQAVREPLHFRHNLAKAPPFPAERGDALAGQVEKVFRNAAAALLCAATPERRAIAGPLLAAAAAATDLMLEEVIRPQVELHRRIAGEREED